MKKRIIKIFLIFFLVFYLASCDNNKLKDYKLKVIETSWSGWEKDYKPKEETTIHEIILNKEYVINKGTLGLTFVIKEINDDYLIINTTESFSDSKDGIDLNTIKKEFTINLDEELKLTTQTMDAGNIYYLSLVKK